MKQSNGAERPPLTDAEIRKRIEEMGVGDRLLFNERKRPVRVTKSNAQAKATFGDDLSGIEVKAPNARFVLDPDEAMYLRRSDGIRRFITWIKKG